MFRLLFLGAFGVLVSQATKDICGCPPGKGFCFHSRDCKSTCTTGKWQASLCQRGVDCDCPPGLFRCPKNGLCKKWCTTSPEMQQKCLEDKDIQLEPVDPISVSVISEVPRHCSEGKNEYSGAVYKSGKMFVVSPSDSRRDGALICSCDWNDGKLMNCERAKSRVKSCTDPEGIAMDKHGNLALLDEKTKRIVLVNTDGEEKGEIKLEKVSSSLEGLEYHNGKFFVGGSGIYTVPAKVGTQRATKINDATVADLFFAAGKLYNLAHRNRRDEAQMYRILGSESEKVEDFDVGDIEEASGVEAVAFGKSWLLLLSEGGKYKSLKLPKYGW